MKKILFATTAIVATASVAAADVSFSGYGRFGVTTTNAAGGSSMVYSRLRLQIDMTTEADNGLTFGARLRHEQDNNGGTITSSTNAANTAIGVGGFNAARLYAKAGGLEVGTGNIYGAIEFMPGVYASTQSAGTGLSGLGFNDILVGNSGGWDAYSSKGAGAAVRQGVEVRYSAGDFSGHLSYSKGGGTTRTAAHVAYTFSGWTAALGYQDGTLPGAVPNDILALTVSGKIGNFGLDLGMSDVSGATNNRYVIRGYMDVGAATKVNAYIANQKGAGAEDNSFGLGVSHSLGGGASVEGGIVRNYAGNTVADLGVRFNF
jgi:outer membrane protein OmpU